MSHESSLDCCPCTAYYEDGLEKNLIVGQSVVQLCKKPTNTKKYVCGQRANIGLYPTEYCPSAKKCSEYGAPGGTFKITCRTVAARPYPSDGCGRAMPLGTQQYGRGDRSGQYEAECLLGVLKRSGAQPQYTGRRKYGAVGKLYVPSRAVAQARPGSSSLVGTPKHSKISGQYSPAASGPAGTAIYPRISEQYPPGATVSDGRPEKSTRRSSRIRQTITPDKPVYPPELQRQLDLIGTKGIREPIENPVYVSDKKLQQNDKEIGDLEKENSRNVKPGEGSGAAPITIPEQYYITEAISETEIKNYSPPVREYTRPLQQQKKIKPQGPLPYIYVDSYRKFRIAPSSGTWETGGPYLKINPNTTNYYENLFKCCNTKECADDACQKLKQPSLFDKLKRRITSNSKELESGRSKKPLHHTRTNSSGSLTKLRDTKNSDKSNKTNESQKSKKLNESGKTDESVKRRKKKTKKEKVMSVKKFQSPQNSYSSRSRSRF